jgi:hypothetical protein
MKGIDNTIYQYVCSNCQSKFGSESAFDDHKIDCSKVYKKGIPYYTKVKSNFKGQPASRSEIQPYIKDNEQAMPNRFHTKVRNALFDQIAARQGAWCLHCGFWPARDGPPDGHGELEIDHADNDTTNWDIENLHILCNKCNLEFRQYSIDMKLQILKQDSDRNVYVCEERHLISDTEILRLRVDYTKGSTELQINNSCEVKFRNWVLKMIDQSGALCREDLINGGAEVAGCSIVTTEKYLKKLTSITGPLQCLPRNQLNQTIITRRHPKSNGNGGH